MKAKFVRSAGHLAGLWLVAAAVVAGQTPGAAPAPQSPGVPSAPIYVEKRPPTSPARVEKLSATSLRVGAVYVDLAKKEVSVSGRVNDVPLLEFLVNTKGGYKSYESAIEADSNAIDFNVGLVLIGLDPARTTARPRFHFDPIAPQGDLVEIWISWKAGAEEKRVRAEELIYDDASK